MRCKRSIPLNHLFFVTGTYPRSHYIYNFLEMCIKLPDCCVVIKKQKNDTKFQIWKTCFCYKLRVRLIFIGSLKQFHNSQKCFQRSVSTRKQRRERHFGKCSVRHTDLGLSYQSGFSITQRREGQAELRLSITLTKIEREREDILMGILHTARKQLFQGCSTQQSK